MKLVKNIMLITLIGLAALLSTTAFGQKHHPHHRHHHNGILSMTEELDLTDEQVEQITAIQEKYKEQIQAIKEKNTADKEELHHELKALFQAQSEEVHALLTEQQMAILDEKKAEREKARAEMKERRANIDREGLREAMKTYRQENILPVMKAQRAKLETKIEAEDKVAIAELREKFEEMHQRMEKANRTQKERSKKELKHKKEEHSKHHQASENPDKERLHNLVKKYEEEIDALFAEVEPQQKKWQEDMKKIAEQYIPKPEGAEKEGAPQHKRHFKHKRHAMHKGQFLLLDPNAPVEATTTKEAALAEMIVYPNPATATNTLQYQVQKAGQVRIELRTKGGNVLKVLLNEYKDIGEYNLDVNLSELEGGIYFYTLIDQQGVTSKKVVVSK